MSSVLRDPKCLSHSVLQRGYSDSFALNAFALACTFLQVPDELYGIELSESFRDVDCTRIVMFKAHRFLAYFHPLFGFEQTQQPAATNRL